MLVTCHRPSSSSSSTSPNRRNLLFDLRNFTELKLLCKTLTNPNLRTIVTEHRTIWDLSHFLSMEKGMEDKEEFDEAEIEYTSYAGEHHLPLIMSLVDQELSEPYSIFTYRYFVYLWPQLSFLAFHKGKCIGTVVSKMGDHRQTFRGYIAMLVVIKPYRGRGIASELVTRSIKAMMESGCEEVTLEAEVSNKGALALYGRLGFIRAKRLYHYYLNGMDAFRLKLLFPKPRVPQIPLPSQDQTQQEQENFTG